MSINLDTATTEEIVAEYGIGIVGITEVLGIFSHGITVGAIRLGDPVSAEEIVLGFQQAVDLLDTLPEAIKAAAGIAGEVTGAGRLVVDLHNQAVAAGLVSTPRSLGNALAQLGIDVTRLDAANGNVEAQKALDANAATIKALGL